MRRSQEKEPVGRASILVGGVRRRSQPGEGITREGGKRSSQKTVFLTPPALQVPQLEEWFKANSHPCHAVVAGYTETLNKLPYRCSNNNQK